MIYHLPIKTVTGLNAREHWRKRAARVKAERHTTASIVKPFPVPCIVRMVRETWRKDSEKSERQVLAFLSGLDLLVIDEMGVQYGTDGEQTILFDVLDGRYRALKPTILLTNQDAEGLKAYLGERTFDRLRETCRFVAFQWESYRPKARKEDA